MSLRILFAGGGTGGHLFPGIAVAEELGRRVPEVEICFAGSTRPIEQQILAQTSYRHLQLEMEPSTGFRRHPFRSLHRFRKACQFAAAELTHFNPETVIGLGGFASLPFVWAASRQHRPVMLLEQNIIAGRATKLGSYFANQLCLSFPETQGRLSPKPEHIVTGNPVRQSILQSVIRSVPSSARKKLIVLGGSQGAHNLNTLVLHAIRTLQTELKDWEIYHQAGEQDETRVRDGYQQLSIDVKVAPFFERLEELYHGATLAICRAGATTLAELACAGCPAILVPYPHAMADHQTENARYFEANGAAILSPEPASGFDNVDASESDQNRLGQHLQRLLEQPDKLIAMQQAMRNLSRPTAAATVVDLLLQ
ncbi:UDP-N-acetylglucosamine--N-acetylmuramyl-(pentapeptide) pyrophosphoryl-undecaprenol N-acetylglucosamine transferase MurG [Polystyrenella longa]|uniref:UDP-N-acetylglucosamine--N-acetylmuramyl-(pentapeptide) pyrophosphoryl-undecaprenol N-acetylglucosamine transferase n=1 Tax=Polystyrenella longa TaxID=2528007 RepID=A0A518CSD9_9PLAN|nr:undecaprenyldiphospho-muramoylpentapeptide beta-N-acetylglucosaminyltransferase [Polystyrenella longa]QDU82130.1 UDP-N-acetylglucosamine--N-acetylmuramyl-(pentapeptide) pyrophosphoryl-undecaprenol N-acetylglucosamine transferase MurG [Polystyrenella longa]